MIKIIKEFEEFMKCNELWDKLNPYCNVFTFHQWLSTWWECYGDDKKLRVYVLFDEQNDVILIFPLMLSNYGANILLSQLCDSCSDNFKMICNPNRFNEMKVVIEYIIQNEKFDKFTINNLRADDENTEAFIRALFWVNEKILISIQERDYFINTNGKYKDYFMTRSKNFRHKINHIRRNSHNFHFDIVFEYDELILDEISKIHCIKWNNEMQVSVFYDQRRIKFLKLICKKYAEKGFLRIFLLKEENIIVAYRLGFICDSTYYDWNTSYNITYKNNSVGILLCDYVVRYCFEKNIKEFDFLRGEEDYKKKFATNNRELLKLNVCKETDRNAYVSLPPKIKLENIMKNVHGFIFDLDGVVYSGKKPIITTIKFINYLLEKNIKFGFLTNTSSRFPNTIRYKLESMGIKDGKYFIETSSTALAEYMKEKGFKNCVVYGGDEVLAEEIKRKDIEVVNIHECNQSVDAVVIGYSKKFEYESLIKINELITDGAELIATDEDKMFAHNGKCLPGTAWILSSIETVNHTKAFVIGKPNSYSALNLLKKMDLLPEDIMVIGDNIESDIMMAKEIGALSCLLLGGVSNEEDVVGLKLEYRPDLVIDDLCKLEKYIKESCYEEKN